MDPGWNRPLRRWHPRASQEVKRLREFSPPAPPSAPGVGQLGYRISNLVVRSLIQTFSSALFGMIKEEIEDREEPVDYYDATQEGIQRAEKYYKIK